MFGVADAAASSTVNVNLLTHLEKDRVLNLVTSGSTFAQAKRQAQRGVLNIFSIQKDSIATSESLNIAAGTDDDAILLAISCIVQVGASSEADLTELLATINNDIKADGVLDNRAILKRMFDAAICIDTNLVKTKLIEKYASIGTPCIVPDYVKYIRQFINGNSAAFTRWGVQFPASSINLLSQDSTSFAVSSNPAIDNYFYLIANVPAGTTLAIKMYALNTNLSTSSAPFGYYINAGPIVGYMPAQNLGGRYMASISLEVNPAYTQIYPNYSNAVKINQAGSYLIDYFVNGAPEPVYSKTVVFQ